MDNEDKYIVYVNSLGDRYYYKNDKQHREAGPAVIYSFELKDDMDLLDNGLYTEVFKNPPSDIKITVAKDTGAGKSNVNLNKVINKLNSYKSNHIITFESPIEYVYKSNYWLNGINYLKEEFDILILKKEIEKDLPTSETKDKKIKI